MLWRMPSFHGGLLRTPSWLHFCARPGFNLLSQGGAKSSQRPRWGWTILFWTCQSWQWMWPLMRASGLVFWS